ncbi:hypothetical protein EI219_06315 [Streptococcus suis]|uniref:Uncharacterized protein n=1 Tax=Streptococcus suis TaxID=1307 RepID=A0A426G404_STRSU|nr:hypothetical protein EI219_06315 [Streptococcus suis]
MKWLKSKYSHLVFLLLLRRNRKLRFLISNFKHSTGLFELALPYSAGVTCSASAISNLAQSLDCKSCLQLLRRTLFAISPTSKGSPNLWSEY